MTAIELRIENVNQAVGELEEAFDAIQQPRPDFVLEKFVLGQHDTEPQAYAQCVLEMQIKYDAIRRAILSKKKLLLQIEELDAEGDAIKQIDADLKRIDIEVQDRAVIGAVREFETLHRLWQGFQHRYTRDELNGAQEEYWVKRLTRQANHDIQATGRVGVGNQEALLQIGRSALPELDHVRDTERRYLEVGDTKLLMVVATEEKAVDGLPCLEKLVIPSGVQFKVYNVFGRSVADAYNDAMRTALQDGADLVLTVEDDTFPPPDAFARLRAHMNGRTIAGAWYPKRTEVQEGVPIIVKDGKRQSLEADGGVHECYTLPMGCTLFPAEAFLKLAQPWFVTTEHLSQDSFFSQLAREAGYKLLCDTSIRCKHIDRETGKVYE